MPLPFSVWKAWLGDLLKFCVSGGAAPVLSGKLMPGLYHLLVSFLNLFYYVVVF